VIPDQRQLLGIAVLLAMVVVIIFAALQARRIMRRKGIIPGRE
jgi:hypothetical protein